MTGRMSDYQVDKWLRDLESCYAALHFDNPDVAGAYASEVFGGGYGRCKTQFSFPSNRAIWNTTTMSFSGLPAVTITHIALWDDLTAGNYLASIGLITPIRVLGGKQLSLGPNLIAVSLD